MRGDERRKAQNLLSSARLYLGDKEPQSREWTVRKRNSSTILRWFAYLEGRRLVGFFWSATEPRRVSDNLRFISPLVTFLFIFPVPR